MNITCTLLVVFGTNSIVPEGQHPQGQYQDSPPEKLPPPGWGGLENSSFPVRWAMDIHDSTVHQGHGQTQTLTH